MSLKDKINAAPKVPFELVDLIELGNDPDTGKPIQVQVNGMTGEQRAQFLDSTNARTAGKEDGAKTTGDDMRETYVFVVSRFVVDPSNGKPIFSEDEAADILSLSGATLEKLTAKAMTLSGMGPKQEEAIAKNS